MRISANQTSTFFHALYEDVFWTPEASDSGIASNVLDTHPEDTELIEDGSDLFALTLVSNLRSSSYFLKRLLLCRSLVLPVPQFHLVQMTISFQNSCISLAFQGYAQ